MGQSNGILRKLHAHQPSSENEPWNVSAPARATFASKVLPDGVLVGPTAEIAARSGAGDTSPDGMSARGREPGGLSGVRLGPRSSPSAGKAPAFTHGKSNGRFEGLFHIQ